MPTSTIDVLDRVLDKGIVIDTEIHIALAGNRLIGVDARIVVASFETYLRYADALAGTDPWRTGRPGVRARRRQPEVPLPGGPTSAVLTMVCARGCTFPKVMEGRTAGGRDAVSCPYHDDAVCVLRHAA